MNVFKRIWSSIKDKVRHALSELPTIDEIIAERKVYARALVIVGDRVSAFEPDEVEALAYVTIAARMTQFVAGRLAGAEKATLVIEQVRAQWVRLGKADDRFDKWWVGLARPMLDAYAGEAKASGMWVRPA